MITIQQTMDVFPYIARNKDNTKKSISTKRHMPRGRSKNIGVSAFCMHLEAQNIHMGRNQMFRWLRENGYLSKQKSTWNMPLRKYINLRLFTVKETYILVADEQVAKYSPLITPEGCEHLTKRLMHERLANHRNVN